MKGEIRFISEYDSQFYSLWQEAFGDSKEEITYFINNCENFELLGCYCDGDLASMLFLVDCRINDNNYKYIYAACTFEKYKKSGFMTELLDYCREHYDFLSLIPANNSLVGFYEKRGFRKHIGLKQLSFEQTDEIKEYLISGCTLKEPYLLCYEKGEI